MTVIKRRLVRASQQPGFSFMEVMIALCVVGLLLTALFGLQNSVLTQIRRTHQLARELLTLQNLWQEHNFRNKLFASAGHLEQVFPQLSTTVHATFTAPNHNSELKRFFNIRLVKLTAGQAQVLVALHLPQLAEEQAEHDNDKIKINESEKGTESSSSSQAPKGAAEGASAGASAKTSAGAPTGSEKVGAASAKTGATGPTASKSGKGA